MLKPLRAALKESEESLARLTAQCDKLSVVCEKLRAEVGGGGVAGEAEGGDAGRVGATERGA